MTANACAEDEKAALDAGMDAHVPKPLDMELLKKVKAHLEEGRTAKSFEELEDDEERAWLEETWREKENGRIEK